MEMTVVVAIVAGVSALLGVLVAQAVAMLQSWLERRNKREILLRTKYEELGSHVLDSTKLPQALLKCTSTEDIFETTHQASANNAHLLALIYFPELRYATGQYIESYSALCLVATSLSNPQDKRPLGMQVFDKPEYVATRNKYIAARDYLQDQIQIHATTYAKS